MTARLWNIPFCLLVNFFLSYISTTFGQPLPGTLSETKLYENIFRKVVAKDNLPYSPQYPLWTDGALKKRWFFLPKGGQIIADNPDQWIFPVGTKFWKEFSFQSRTESVRVETRYIEKVSEDEWLFGSYLWNSQETEALLAPEDGVADYFSISGSASHSIPSVTQCLRCHRKEGDPVLGFDALQLSNERDPFALHSEKPEPNAVFLKMLIKGGNFNVVSPKFNDGAVRIPTSSNLARTVYGYFHSNCSSCHNSFGSSVHLRMDLAFKLTATTEYDLSAFQTLIDKKCTVFQFPGEANGIRIVRGEPDKSVLYRMMQGHGSEHMPPIGSVIHDSEAIQRIREWILRLSQKQRRLSGFSFMRKLPSFFELFF